MFDLIKTLCELPGPAGDEGPVQAWLTEHWTPRVESIAMTGVGNLIAHVGGHGPRLVVGGHADEISFVVKHIDDNGFVWITSGQRDLEQRPSLRGPFFLPLGHPALILTTAGPVSGFFATLTGHILTPTQRKKTELDWNDVWVDIGAGSRAEARSRGVQVGDRVIWNPPTRQSGPFAYGNAMDNRVALAIMDRLLDDLDRARLAYELVFVSTVQEELGLIGAESIGRQVSADLAIALDTGLAGDVPGVDQRDVSNRLGDGPALVHKDLYSYSRLLTLALARTAQAAGVSVQNAVYGVYGSDAGAFIRQGIPAALVAVPSRYTHSPFEMVHLGDVMGAVTLLKAFLESPPPAGLG